MMFVSLHDRAQKVCRRAENAGHSVPTARLSWHAMAKRASRASRPLSSADESVDTQAATNDMLRQGQEAIDAYDYELARNLLERAFSQSGNTDAALALLTLLVDHLVADHDALALWPNLSSETRGSNDIRVLLALSAARTGDVSRAKQLVAGIDGARAADVMTLLATNVLDSGDWAEAGRLADDARTRDSAHPGARDIAERIANVRAVDRSRLEDEMALALEEGNRQEALRIAECIVAVFPESAAARHIIRAATDEKRHDDAKQHVVNAEEALARGDLDTALQWLRRAEQALATSSKSDALRAHITILEAEAKARATANAIADISASLAKDTKSALLRYAAAQDEIRVEVRKKNSSLVLDLLERILQKRVKAEDAVDAVLDLGEAVATVDRDPKSALDKIIGHERILTGIAEATKVQARARELLENDRVRRVSKIFDAARAAIDEGNAQQALDTLGQIDTHDVRASERQALEALRNEANAIIELWSLGQLYEQLLSSDPLAACEIAEQILARPDANRIQWQEAIAVARRNARRKFGVWVAEDPASETLRAIEGPVTIDLDVPVRLPMPLDQPLPWIDSDAQTFVLTESHDRWIFIRVIQAATGKVISRVILRMPERVEGLDAQVTRSNTLCVISEEAAVFEISLESWDPLFWRASHELVPRGEIVDHVKIIPESRYVWAQLRRDNELGRVRIIDAQRRRVVRELEDIWSFEWVVDAHESRMICSNAGDRVTVRDIRGVPTPERLSLPNTPVNHAVVHPSGHGILAACGMEDELVEFHEIGCVSSPTGFGETNDERDPKPQMFSQRSEWVSGVPAWRVAVLVTSLRRRNAYFIAAAEEGPEAVFEEMGFVNGEFRSRLQEGISAAPHIVQDGANQNVFALFQDGLRLHFIPLTETVPVVPAIHYQHQHLPNPLMSFGCGLMGERSAETARFVVAFEYLSPSTKNERLHAFGTSMASSPVDLFDTHQLLVSMNKTKVAAALFSWMQQHLPLNFYTSLLVALNALKQGSAPEAIQRFDALRLDAIAERHRQHVCHEFALALIQAGEFECAVPVLRTGMLTGEGRCNLQELLELVEPLPNDVEDPGASVIRRIRLTARKFDAYFGRGDVVGAREAIDVVHIWDAGEVQSLARLAEAYLQFEPRDDAERFRKALALARFVGEHRVPDDLRHELIVDKAKWPKSKVDEIDARASKWLEGLA